MIIVLKSADFSANNIGKIDISNTLSTRTKEIASRFSKNLNDYTLFALQELIDWLDSESILTNMDGLYLPCLAGTVEESFINVAKAPFEADLIPKSTVFELRNNGIRTKVTGSSAAEDKLMVKTTAPVNDMHLLWFNTEEYTGLDKNEPIYPFGGTANNNYSFSDGEIEGTYVAGMPQSILANYTLNTLGVGRKNNKGYITPDKSLKGINHKNVGSVAKLIIYTPEKRETEYTNVIDYDSMTKSMGDFNLAGASNKSMLIPHGIISIGRGLTDEQVLQYNNLCLALINTL